MPSPSRRVPILGIAALALLAVPSGPARGDVARDWNKTFAVAAHPVIRVQTGDARVRIHPGAEGAVIAGVHFRSQHWGFTSPSREPSVRLEVTNGAVEIEVRDRASFAIFGAISENLMVDVTVPADCDLSVRTGDGTVGLEGPLRGTFNVGSGDGRITLRAVRGAIRMTTGDGAIEAVDLDGSVFAHASDGRVHLDGRFDALDVHSGDGHVDVTARPGSQLASDWRLETADGPLDLSIPRDLKAELDARTGDGRIHFDLPVTVSGRLDPHVVRGRLNGGGPLLRLRTGDGALTLGVTP